MKGRKVNVHGNILDGNITNACGVYCKCSDFTDFELLIYNDLCE